MRVYANSRGITGLSLGPVGLAIVGPLVVGVWLVWLLAWTAFWLLVFVSRLFVTVWRLR